MSSPDALVISKVVNTCPGEERQRFTGSCADASFGRTRPERGADGAPGSTQLQTAGPPPSPEPRGAHLSARGVDPDGVIQQLLCESALHGGGKPLGDLPGVRSEDVKSYHPILPKGSQ